MEVPLGNSNLSRMPRRKRCYLPGSAFHLVARTNRGEEFFCDPERRDFIVNAIDRSIRKTDVRLYAFAVMSNHIHLVIRQGVDSIAQLMHPLLREVARAVHRWETGDGHIFSRPFYESPCSDPAYLRQAIAYVNLNPERAELCDDSIDYAWTSHAEYCNRVIEARVRSTELVSILPLFASGIPGQSEVNDYLAYLRWCRRCDSMPDGVRRPPAPNAPVGDDYWTRHFQSTATLEFMRSEAVGPNTDSGAAALEALHTDYCCASHPDNCSSY
jgi:REP element-mobilizing transposase RayT